MKSEVQEIYYAARMEISNFSTTVVWCLYILRQTENTDRLILIKLCMLIVYSNVGCELD